VQLALGDLLPPAAAPDRFSDAPQLAVTVVVGVEELPPGRDDAGWVATQLGHVHEVHAVAVRAQS
jgi:hypothetical protein